MMKMKGIVDTTNPTTINIMMIIIMMGIQEDLKTSLLGKTCSLKDHLSRQGNKIQQIVQQDHLLVLLEQTTKMAGGSLEETVSLVGLETRKWI